MKACHFLFYLFFILSRPDLMDNYLALVLSAFIRNGLLEVSSDFKLNCKINLFFGTACSVKSNMDVVCAPHI